MAFLLALLDLDTLKFLSAQDEGNIPAYCPNFERTAAGQLVEVALDERGPARQYSLFTAPSEDEAGILFTVAEDGDLTPSLAGIPPGTIS